MEGRAIALALDVAELPPKQAHELDEHRGPAADASCRRSTTRKQEYRWGMAIDLVPLHRLRRLQVACQAENNIPVGRARSRCCSSREMHWLRVDRYYEGGPRRPAVGLPADGLRALREGALRVRLPGQRHRALRRGANEMVYNRCVGTRYCSNNCPYKVRRFNCFDYHGEHDAAPEQMLQNPDVTVRARGVMEKCTYCVQRIERARIDARVDGPEDRRRRGGRRPASRPARPRPSSSAT